MVGSDALLLGDYPSPRSYGTFPKVLGDLVRDEGLLSMADAIRKITSQRRRSDLGSKIEGFCAMASQPIWSYSIRSRFTRRQPWRVRASSL